MTTTSTLAAALVKARRKFGPALKDKNNPAFRTKYADLGACLDAVDDALLEFGIALTQETTPDERGVTIETVLVHESGEERRFGKLHVPAAKHDPQGFGSALTYARRYSVCAALGIAPEDDDGNAATKAQREAQAKREQEARQQQREHWLADQLAAIEAASTAGELKKLLAAAIATAAGERDDDAIERLEAAAAAKVEKAKAKQHHPVTEAA